MLAWVLLPLVLTGAFGLLAPALARRLPPAVGTWLLSTGAVVMAGASSASLALLAFLFLAQTPVATERGHWSAGVLHRIDPYALPIGLLALAACVLLALRFLRVAGVRFVAVRDAHRLAAALPDTGTDLAVLDLPDAHAFAVPGRPGRIVVTTAMLRVLDAGQRRALLAHERAHLDGHHHVHQSAVALAAAVNPLLARVPAALGLSCERWADEHAGHVCPRPAVADALERAGAVPRPARLPAAALAATASDVLTRCAALRSPANALSRWRLAVLAGLMLATTTATAIALHDTERLFEFAQLAYRAGQR